jgi:hypothetical protein
MSLLLSLVGCLVQLPGGTVNGVVVDGSGARVGDARIEVIGRTASGVESVLRTVASDSNGRFRVSTVDGHSLRIAADGWRPVVVVLPLTAGRGAFPRIVLRVPDCFHPRVNCDDVGINTEENPAEETEHFRIVKALQSVPAICARMLGSLLKLDPAPVRRVPRPYNRGTSAKG